jgi:DNA primase
VTYLVVDDLPALIWAANLAGLELHVPMWRMPDVRRPDLLVFDLDPGEPADIVDCCRVAQACARCSRPRASPRWPRPRAARACSSTPRSPA